MRWILTFFVVLNLAKILNCQKLTESENEKRLASCGRKVQSKIYQGKAVSSISVSPWTVSLRKESIHCTGTIISPRHVLFANHCVLDKVQDMKSYEVDVSGCQGNDYISNTDQNLTKNVLVFGGSTLLPFDTPMATGKKLFLLGACGSSPHMMGLADVAIVELNENLKLGPSVNMACISHSPRDVEGDHQVEFYGFGSNPAPNTNDDTHSEPTLLYETSRIRQDPKPPKNLRKFFPKLKKFFYTKTENSIACAGDSGGGVVREIDGRVTVVGVASQTTCANEFHGKTSFRGKNGYELWATVGFENDKICEYTGICEPSRRAPGSKNAPENGATWNRSFLLLCAAIFLING